MKKIFNILAASLAALAIFVSPAFAVGNGQVQNAVQNGIANRCGVITERVDLIVNRYDENKERHVQRYQNIEQNVSDLVTKLESQGYDVTQLKTDLAQLHQYNKDFAYEYTLFVNQLKQSKGYACGNSEGEFKNAVGDARECLLQAREASLNIRLLVNDQIRGDLQTLLNEIKADQA